jgi:hypothetical protein
LTPTSDGNSALVDTAVEAIVEALTAHRPKTRYLIGRDARIDEVLRRLPDGLRTAYSWVA